MVEVDSAGRQAFNAIFGDRVSAGRTPDVLVQFQYGISSYDVTAATSGTGAASASNAVATLTTGAGTGSASLTSVSSVRYQPGFDGYAYFTSAFIGATALSFVRRAGASDDVQAITFSGKSADVDITKINIYRISYGWLGVAPNVLEVYNGIVDGWVVVGVFSVLNFSVVPSVYQPALPVQARVSRTNGEEGVCEIGIFDTNNGYFIRATGPNGETALKSCSWSAGRIGGAVGTLPSDRPFGATNSKTGVTTETAILSVKNAAIFQGQTNRVVAEVDIVSLACDGTKAATFRLKKGVTLGGSPSFSDVDATNSVSSVDTAGTTVSGGTTVLPVQLSKVESKFVGLGGYKILILPGETLTITASSSVSSDVSAAIRWRELF